MNLFDHLWGRRSDNEPSRPVAPQASNESTTVPRGEDPLVVLERSLQAVRESIRAHYRHLQELSSEERAALEQIEERREFVRSQQLDTVLCWFLSEVRHYAAWSQRPDASERIKLPLTDITGEDDAGAKVIRFNMGDQRYELRFKRWPHYGGWPDDVSFADLSLSDAGGTPLLALRVKQNVDQDHEYDRWHPSSIEAFRSGEWAVMLTSIYMSEKMARGRDVSDALSGLSRLDELRKAFGLPDSEPPA